MVEEEYSVLGSAAGVLQLNHETKGWIRIAPCTLQFLDVSKGFVLRATHSKNVLLYSPVSSLQFKAVSNTAHEFVLPDEKQYRMEYEKVTDASNFCTLLENATHEQRKLASSKANEMASRPQQQIGGTQQTENGEVIDSLINDLMISVNNGDIGKAGEIAQRLAEKRIPLSVSQDSSTPNITKIDNTISLRISVEDRFESSKAKITMNVRPSISIRTLKEKMYNTYGFPPRVQKWIVGQRIVNDHETLKSLNIDSSGFMIYLYLVSAKTAELSKDEGERKPEENRTEFSGENLVSELPQAVPEPRIRLQPPPAVQPVRQPGKSPVKMDEVMKFVKGFMEQPAGASVPQSSAKKTALDVGWICEGCTMINAPRRPSCHMCTMPRPENYVLPPIDSYELDDIEKKFIEEEKQHEDVLRQAPVDLRGAGFQRGGGDQLRLGTQEPRSLISFQEQENSF